MVSHDGEAKAEAWAKRRGRNLARTPQGGDTDQIKAVAAGSARSRSSTRTTTRAACARPSPTIKGIVDKTGIVWPDQARYGMHVNVSGGGMLKSAPHKRERGPSSSIPRERRSAGYFADGNDEWPAVKDGERQEPRARPLGEFKADPLSIAGYGRDTAEAQKIVDSSGWK